MRHRVDRLFPALSARHGVSPAVALYTAVATVRFFPAGGGLSYFPAGTDDGNADVFLGGFIARCRAHRPATGLQAGKRQNVVRQSY